MWMFARNITEMGEITYQYEQNDTISISTNDTLISYYCNPNYIIIDDPDYENNNSLGFYIWLNNDNEYIDKSKGVSTIHGFYFHRLDYLSMNQRKTFSIYFWLTMLGLNISGVLLFIRALAICKKDEYFKRYLSELTIFGILSIILLSIGISLITKDKYSCKSTLNEILISSLIDSPIIYNGESDLESTNGETILILYGMIVTHCIFVIVLTAVILRMTYKEKKNAHSFDDDDEAEQYMKNTSISEGPGDGRTTTTDYDNPNLQMFTTTDV